MRRRLALTVVLGLLAVPGLFLLFRDVVRPSREVIADRAQRWHPHVRAAAERFDLDPALLIAVIAVESRGDPEARSHRGAMGLMQLMPATARETAERIGISPFEEEDLFDGATNILLGSAYLKGRIEEFWGDESLALAAYHAGPSRVSRWVRESAGAETPEILAAYAFPVTRQYVKDVLEYRDLIAGRYEGNEPE